MSMRCEAQIARFWLLRRRVSQSLRAHSQTRKHWGREWGITLKELVVYMTDYILTEEENHLQPVTTVDVKQTPLS